MGGGEMKVVFTIIHGCVLRVKKKYPPKTQKSPMGVVEGCLWLFGGGIWDVRWCVNEESTLVILNVDYLSMKQGSLFCFVTLRSLEARPFMPYSWYLWKALNEHGCTDFGLRLFGGTCESY
jgi:hypothetical protein